MTQKQKLPKLSKFQSALQRVSEILIEEFPFVEVYGLKDDCECAHLHCFEFFPAVVRILERNHLFYCAFPDTKGFIDVVLIPRISK